MDFLSLVAAVVVGLFGVTVAHAAASSGGVDLVALRQIYIDNSFKMIDANHNGVIDRNEWNAFLAQYLDKQRKAFDASFEAADTNRDGKLSRAEVQAVNPPLAKYFDQIDVDHRGYLTKEDIRAAVVKELDIPLGQ
ncbi:EF-hand domain-containing protein [Burkholderia cepacia]|uniref:EF-hand domain-containing protein n=1 Tax=Burkholderia cepacia TaxID=292 RepID=UPI00075A645B|nr:EF-hand domain-containing protein [Burkholderia cepacia]KVK94143.1 hypothetical protein WS93_28000 [Burkholderia cepacia]